MMTPQEIKIGTRLEFEMLDKRDEKVGHTFASQLLEHQDDGSMVIYAPISESRVVFVPRGITVRLTFVHPLHGLLGFKALVISKEYRGNIAVLIVEPADMIEKLQRREHYRLDLITDVLIWPVVEGSEPAEPENEADGTEETQASALDIKQNSAANPTTDRSAEAAPIKAYTKNLSGSGICVVSETYFAKKAEVRIELDLSYNIKFRAKCVILRSQPIEIRKSKSYELGMRFIEITARNQDNLIKYIFEQQRMLLKKEK